MTKGWMIDLKQALRALRLRPGAAFTVIATVALAVGATTSVYSVVHGVLLQPLPYPDAERLAQVWQTRDDWRDSPNASRRAIADRISPSAPVLREWRKESTGFASLGAYVDANYVLQGGSGADVLRGQEVTAAFFETLGINPLLGRSLQPADDEAGAPRVVVLSEALWEGRFEGRADALGSSLMLDGAPHTVVGVMPASFQPPAWDLASGRPGLWTSLTAEARVGNKSVSVIGRLEPEISLETAAQRIATIQARLAIADPVRQGKRGSRVESLLDSVVGPVRSTLWFLLGAVALVLVIATVNIANILAVLGLERRRELAVRAALGAGERRLMRGMFVESGVLTALGGLAGVLVAWGSLPLLLRLVPPTIPRQEQIGISPGVLLFGLAMTGMTTLLVGAFPAILAARAQPQEVLRASTKGLTAGRGGSRFRAVLVVAEVSLAFVLLVGAALLSSSFARLWSVDRGFTTDGLLAMTVVPDPQTYSTRDDYDQFARTLQGRLSVIPGVRASVANNVPLSGDYSGTFFYLENSDRQSADEATKALLSVGLESYLEVMGIPIVVGRAFERGDSRDALPVAVVNQTLARKFWPGEAPIGKRLRLDEESPWREVVGVAADVRHVGLSTAVEPKVYLPAAQSLRDTFDWILRTQGSSASTIRDAKEVVASLSPTTPVSRVMVLDETIAGAVAVPRFRTFFVVGLAALAGALALLGVYGILAFAVAQRRKEIGIRIALGARTYNVVMNVVGSGLKLTMAGVAVGLVFAWFGSAAVEQFLFETTSGDVTIYLVMASSVLLVGCAAAYLPARRAAAVDPIGALKND